MHARGIYLGSPGISFCLRGKSRWTNPRESIPRRYFEVNAFSLQRENNAPTEADEPKAFMVVKLNETWYPYCEIDAATVQRLIAAESAGTFYNQAIRSRPDGSHGPFDCRDHPMPDYPR